MAASHSHRTILRDQIRLDYGSVERGSVTLAARWYACLEEVVPWPTTSSDCCWQMTWRLFRSARSIFNNYHQLLRGPQPWGTTYLWVCRTRSRQRSLFPINLARSLDQKKMSSNARFSMVTLKSAGSGLVRLCSSFLVTDLDLVYFRQILLLRRRSSEIALARVVIYCLL